MCYIGQKKQTIELDKTPLKTDKKEWNKDFAAIIQYLGTGTIQTYFWMPIVAVHLILGKDKDSYLTYPKNISFCLPNLLEL